MIFNMSTGGASTADKVKYNNTESGLQSTDVQGAIDEVNSSLEWINKPYTQIYSSNTINENSKKITTDLSQYNELMLGIEENDILYVNTVVPKSFNNTVRAMIDDTKVAQMRIETDGIMVWRIMPNSKYYLCVYAR